MCHKFHTSNVQNKKLRHTILILYRKDLKEFSKVKQYDFLTSLQNTSLMI